MRRCGSARRASGTVHALSAQLAWPVSSPRGAQTSWQAAAPQLHALVVHCYREAPDSKGDVSFVLHQEGVAPLVPPSFTMEPSPSPPLTACLQRDAYAFLRGLHGSDWQARVKASLTGKRDTSNWAQMADLSSTAPGGRARVTMAWRRAWVTSAVTLPRARVGGRVKKE